MNFKIFLSAVLIASFVCCAPGRAVLGGNSVRNGTAGLAVLGGAAVALIPAVAQAAAAAAEAVENEVPKRLGDQPCFLPAAFCLVLCCSAACGHDNR